MSRLLASGILVSGLLGALAAQQPPSPPPQPPTAAQQRPVFRGGTHFVRVDAYPSQNGKIVEGLTAEDFEILEDGKPQKIDSLDFIKFDTLTPDAVRRDPQSQREGFDLAADPRYRLFVIYVDMSFSSSAGPFASIPNLPHIQQPLANFLERIIGIQDLYGFLTSRSSVKDLVLAQKTMVTVEQINDLWRANTIDRDEADEVFLQCPPEFDGLKPRYRADHTYSNLRDLIYQMGSLRQERKNVVFISNLLPRWRADLNSLDSGTEPPPRIGGSEGRVVLDKRETSVSGKPSVCMMEKWRLMSIDFDARYKELLRDAKRENVSFYILTPGGLQAPATVAGTRAVTAAYDDLRSLADETDGLAVVNTNDLNSGMKKIADDLAAYYVLGYYTTNTNFDGGLRTLKVRYKGTGRDIRARRQYRAPTRDEINTLAASAAGPGGGRGSGADATSLRAAALAALDDPAHGRKVDLPARTLIGEPAVFRVAPRSAAQPVSILHFDRTDRVRIDWPILAPTDGRVLRMLDRGGRPLPVELPLTEDPDSRRLSLVFPLAAFSRADYIIELTVTAGSVSERRLLALRVK
jgi:VWFA-related protein